MTAPRVVPQSVQLPWLASPTPVDLDWVDSPGNEAELLSSVAEWDVALKKTLELACFADYLCKVFEVDAQPGDFPALLHPKDVWNHIEVVSVRPHCPDIVVVYAVPAWQPALHHEWCIKGVELIYVGQVLCFEGDSYEGVVSGNFARGAAEAIAQYEHVLKRFANHT